QSGGTLTGADPCEAVEHTAGPAPDREALDVGEGDHLRRTLPLRPPVAPQLVHDGFKAQGARQVERFAERAGQRHTRTGTAEGPVGTTQVPEVPRREAEHNHTAVVEVERAPPIAGRVVVGDTPLGMRERRSEAALVVLCDGSIIVTEEDEG